METRLFVRSRHSPQALLLALLAATPLVAADASLLGLIPPGAAVAGGFDAERLGASGVGRRMLARLPGAAEYRSLIATTGEVVFTTSGVADAGMLAIARGKFAAGPLVEAARSRGETISTYRDVTTIASRDGVVALLSDTIIAVGDEKSVHGTVDRFQAAGKPDEALLARATELSALHHGWLVMSGSPALAMAEAAPNRTLSGALRGDLFQAIQSMSMGFRGGAASLEVVGEALTRSEKDAVALTEALKFLTQMVQDLSGTEIRADGATVRFNGKVPAAFLEKLLELALPAPRKP